MENYYSIQDVSRMLGIPKDTLRYYDRVGIVSPSREDNRYRRYSQNDLVDLMNVQIMRYADFSLDEIKGKFGFHRMEHPDPARCREVAAFLDAKLAETRKKIAHLEKVGELLGAAAATLRNLDHESDLRLAESVRELYRTIRKKEPDIFEEGCRGYQD